MPTQYDYENLNPLVFKPDVDVSGALTISVMNDDDPSVPQSLGTGDSVLNYVDPTVIGSSSVQIRFEDPTDYDIQVQTVGGATWDREPSGAPTRSVFSQVIPDEVDDQVEITVSVVAKDPVTGQPVAGPSAQVIIIKRRPPQ